MDEKNEKTEFLESKSDKNKVEESFIVTEPAIIDNEDEENDDVDIIDENAIVELNTVSILNSSKISLKHVGTHKKDYIEDANTSKQSFQVKCKKEIKRFVKTLPYKGLILAVFCGFCSSISSIFAKLAYSFTGSDIAFIRYSFQFLIMFTIIKCKNLNMFGPKSQRKLLTIRAFVGTSGLVTFYFAFKLIDPSDCLAISQSSIIITAIFAKIFLKEKLSIAHIVALILAVIGIFLISKPKSLFQYIYPKANNNNNTSLTSNKTFEMNSMIQSDNSLNITLGILLALACAFASGSVQVMLKKLCNEKVHFSTVTIFTTFVGIPTSLCISIILVLCEVSHKTGFQDINKLLISFVYSIASSLFGVAGQVSLNLSLKYEDATKISILRTLDVFLTFFLQTLWLKIPIDLFSVVGSALLLMGTVLILIFKLIEDGYNKTEEQKKDNNIILKCIRWKF